MTCNRDARAAGLHRQRGEQGEELIDEEGNPTSSCACS